MNYLTFRSVSTQLVKYFGMPIKVLRGRSQLTVGWGVFVNDQTKLDTTTPELQTTLTNRTLLVIVPKEPEVGDLIETDKTTYTVKAVERIRPTNLTVLHKLEVA